MSIAHISGYGSMVLSIPKAEKPNLIRGLTGFHWWLDIGA
jgi:hypothetical protein